MALRSSVWSSIFRSVRWSMSRESKSEIGGSTLHSSRVSTVPFFLWASSAWLKRTFAFQACWLATSGVSWSRTSDSVTAVKFGINNYGDHSPSKTEYSRLSSCASQSAVRPASCSGSQWHLGFGCCDAETPRHCWSSWRRCCSICEKSLSIAVFCRMVLSLCRAQHGLKESMI